MKRILLIIVILILTISLIISINKKEIKDNFNYRELSSLAIKVETDNDSNTYEIWKDNTFPKEGYVLNSKLSTCQNGSTITWNNGNIILKANKSDSCNAFFDKVYYYEECDDSSFACYIAQKQGTKVGDNNEELILHNGKIDVNKDGTYDDAGDLSYRYSGDNPDNFVCFGTEEDPCPVQNLYRIIGVFPNQKKDGSLEYRVKLIKSEYITGVELGQNSVIKISYSKENCSTPRISILSSIDGFYYSEDNTLNTWETSSLYQNLNGTYYNKFSSDYQRLIDTNLWNIGGFDTTVKLAKDLYKSEVETNDKLSFNIGALYGSEYGFAASKSSWKDSLVNYTNEDIKTNNWLYNGVPEYTISHSSKNTKGLFFLEYVGYYADYGSSEEPKTNIALRPTFYLKSDVKYISGSGTESSPYRIGF